VDNEENHTGEQILDLVEQRQREGQVVDVEVAKTLIVIFSLGSHSSPEAASSDLPDGFYGLPATAVESIVPVEQVTYVPGTPPWLLGVVNVRGEIESVLDLKAVLGLGRTELAEQTRLLISQEGELRSGLLVDEVVDIAALISEAIGPPPTPLEGGKGIYIAGETEYAAKSLVILDLAAIFHRALETDSV